MEWVETGALTFGLNGQKTSAYIPPRQGLEILRSFALANRRISQTASGWRGGCSFLPAKWQLRETELRRYEV